jgi:hypothetical protein
MSRFFSFTRVINNAFPNFALDSPNDVDLSPSKADALVRYQLALPNPRHLSPSCFMIAGITDNESNSKKVFNALAKAGIVDKDGQDAMTVHTSRIDNSIANRLAVISVHAQRKVVGLLFFWEEECTRWRLLDQEECEVRTAMAEHETPELEVAMAAVQRKRLLLPSQRAGGNELPVYSRHE